MKKTKCFLMIIASLFFLVINANAYTILTDFTLDLSAINPDFGTYTNVTDINYDSILKPNTEITQYLGADNVLGNGDTFSETGFMNLSSISATPPGFPIDLYDDTNMVQYYINVYYEDITGSISNYSDGGTPFDLTDDTWNYTFDTGSGTVGWYLDTDLDPTNGTSGAVLTGSIIPLSSGTADGFLSGAGSSSNWDITVEVDSALAGLLLDSEGNDLFDLFGDNDWLLTITTGDTTIQQSIFNPGPDGVAGGGDDYFTFIGDTGDQTVVAVVPEPGTMVLLGLGLIGIAGVSRKKFMKK